ncbi:Uroporphyrinogen decarboxylase (URO-D) [Fragilaria crotonensis]|nr:Uroporphyrinogen decarboxylase (URO-D) [Fragilaria crotonensis]
MSLSAMQPIRRYDLDAAILFSDILVIAQALQIDVIMPGGVGIQVPNPLAEPLEVEHRIPKTSEMTTEYVDAMLGYVMRSVKLIREKMAEEGIDIPLIGFSAAPWTLLFYMVGGSSKKNTDIVEAGAHMLQVFEAMGMMIEEQEFNDFALPCLAAIAKEIKFRFPNVPLMGFARGASHANDKLAALGYDVVTIDGSVDRSSIRSVLGENVPIQGNYDPAELIVANGKTVETVKATAKEMLEELGTQRLIANLGEGLGGQESPDLVKAFVDAIHSESTSMIAAEAGFAPEVVEA